MKPDKMTFFLALEANDGSHQYIEFHNATVDEAIDFTEDAFKYTHYRAVYLFDAYCPACYTFGAEITCDHSLEPATHVDFVHCRIDVAESKRGVEK